LEEGGKMPKNVGKEKTNENVKVVPQSKSPSTFLNRSLNEKEYRAYLSESVFEKYGKNLLSPSTFPQTISIASKGRLAAAPISYSSLSSLAALENGTIGRIENVEKDRGLSYLKISFDFSDLPSPIRKTLINNLLPSVLLGMRKHYLHSKTSSEVLNLFNSWLASHAPNVYLVSRQDENAQASFRADSVDSQSQFFCIHIDFVHNAHSRQSHLANPESDYFVVKAVRESIYSILPALKDHLFLVVSSSRQTDDSARALANLIANVAGQKAEVIVFPYEQNPSKKEGRKSYKKLVEENNALLSRIKALSKENEKLAGVNAELIEAKLQLKVLKAHYSMLLESSKALSAENEELKVRLLKLSQELENSLNGKKRLESEVSHLIGLLRSLRSVLSEAKFGNRAEKIEIALTMILSDLQKRYD
jgi:hypothetical protein